MREAAPDHVRGGLFSCAVFDVRVGPIGAGGELGVPLALLVLVFDGFGPPGRALLGGGAPRRIERFGVGRKALREGAVD